jgi:hypothetical protein
MKRCILFSGGWDSILCALKDKEADLLFIDYGQIYNIKEIEASLKFSNRFTRNIYFSNLNLKTDQKMRNVFLILEAMRLGYTEIVLGTRNIMPIFDKYKDSNWLSLYILSKILKIRLIMPLIGKTKSNIVKQVRKEYSFMPYNCYFNNSDFKTCTCINCREIKNILNA